MSTVVEVCNMAIGRVGISTTISDINENTLAARSCKRFFNSAIRRCLETGVWNFASRYKALQDVGSPLPGWSFRYKYPVDCLKAMQIMSSLGASSALVIGSEPVPFQISEDEATGGLVISCNIESPTLKYVANIQNTALWSEHFASAVAWMLASEIAAPLSAEPGFARMAGEQYRAAIREAQAFDRNQGQENKASVSEFESVRS